VNKTELAQHLAEKTGLGSGDAKKAVDGIADILTETLSRGGEVAVAGLGKFSVTERSARQGVNPATGEKIQIAASKAPKFTAAKALKDAVNGR
jgi:DNA-binding protein HU-beta